MRPIPNTPSPPGLVVASQAPPPPPLSPQPCFLPAVGTARVVHIELYIEESAVLKVTHTPPVSVWVWEHRSPSPHNPSLPCMGQEHLFVPAESKSSKGAAPGGGDGGGGEQNKNKTKKTKWVGSLLAATQSRGALRVKNGGHKLLPLSTSPPSPRLGGWEEYESLRPWHQVDPSSSAVGTAGQPDPPATTQ